MEEGVGRRPFTKQQEATSSAKKGCTKDAKTLMKSAVSYAGEIWRKIHNTKTSQGGRGTIIGDGKDRGLLKKKKKKSPLVLR